MRSAWSAFVLAWVVGVGLATYLPRWSVNVAYLNLGLSPVGATASRTHLRVITVRDSTFDRLGVPSIAGTLPRSVHAELLRRLHQAGARAVVYDLLFDEPSPEDQAMRDALVDVAPMRVVVPVRPLGDAGRSADAFTFAVRRPTILPLLRPPHVSLAHPITWEPDGVLRGIKTTIEDANLAGQIYPHLSLEAVRSMGDPLEPWVVSPGEVRCGHDRWDTERTGAKLIRFGADFPDEELGATLSDLRAGRGDTYRGAIVFIGATNQGQRLDDMHPTPRGDMSGVQFSAQAANSLGLPRESQIRIAPPWVELVLSGLMAALALLIARKMTTLRVIGAVMVPVVATLACTHFLIAFTSTWLGVFVPSSSAVFAVAILAATLTIRAHPIWKARGWEGRTETVAAMFVDIEGSTQLLAEASDPAGLLVTVQKIIAEVVESHGGYVERTMGDGAFIVFRQGTQQERAEQAYRVMRRLRDEMASRQGAFVARHRVAPTLVVGAEMATVAGAVLRSRSREEFSSFGRDIARAQRIESQARTVASRMAIGLQLYTLLGLPPEAVQAHTRLLKGYEEEGEQPVFEV